ncbi:hypothetical protein [Gordonia neofelifaecis]|uniref:Uncharacterized protein n=1 Tax=Gordonia neofelifaecis NRRL B-59395 TaxID=644548 RepID=F1YP57_9ACTN|nr:hypothetical protein [Gordonia neofelifaecis]EGD53506.1 hypothetical protein SCNU_18317 [Gordonia neofelifaecis NRRL B-59395]
MAQGKESNSGCLGIVGVVLVVGVIAMIPKAVWIAIGVIAGLAVLVWIGVGLHRAWTNRRASRRAEMEEHRVRQEAAVRQQRVETLGAANSQCVEESLAAAREVAESEAALVGWLGDVDFTADIDQIVASFERVRSLRRVAGELGRLDEPNDDDRRLLAEAREAATRLEAAATARAQLIVRCAEEARRIDESIQRERDEARTADERDRLHRELTGMLYGTENAPAGGQPESAADRVMARVAGYREIKEQIVRAREPDVG